MLNTTLGVKELVANEFAKLEEEVLVPHKQLFPFDVTQDDFFWAFGMLRSRAFTRLEGQSLVLIPLADLVIIFFLVPNFIIKKKKHVLFLMLCIIHDEYLFNM